MPQIKRQDKLVVIAGPDAVGKDVLANELIKRLPLKKVITTTTRLPRPGEKRGVDYHFVSIGRFEEMIKQDLLVEFATYGKDYYGWLRADLRKTALSGLAPLLIAHPKEAIKIQRHFPSALVIFVKPDSLMNMRKRLLNQGGTLDEIEEKLRLIKETMHSNPVFAYNLANPEGKLEDTVRTAKRILRRYLGI